MASPVGWMKDYHVQSSELSLPCHATFTLRCPKFNSILARIVLLSKNKTNKTGPRVPSALLLMGGWVVEMKKERVFVEWMPCAGPCAREPTDLPLHRHYQLHSTDDGMRLRDIQWLSQGSSSAWFQSLHVICLNKLNTSHKTLKDT